MAKKIKAGGRPNREMSRFAFFLRDADKVVLQQIADREGLNLADVVRRAAHEMAERELARRKEAKV